MQGFFVNIEFAEAVKVGCQRGAASFYIALDIAVVLLKVLRPEEHAFRPHNFITIRHEKGFAVVGGFIGQRI